MTGHAAHLHFLPSRTTVVRLSSDTVTKSKQTWPPISSSSGEPFALHDNHATWYAVSSSLSSAGVSGLTTALHLVRNGQYNITVVAKHMPGDYDIEYASPWAGANSLPYLRLISPNLLTEPHNTDPPNSVAKPGSASQQYEQATWTELARLAKDLPEAGIHFQDAFIYRRAKDAGSATGDWGESILHHCW